MKNSNRFLGIAGEAIAENYLSGKGFKILAKNFISRYGEIDIICEKEDCYYFFEVKSRLNDEHIKPFESVNDKKIRKISNTMEFFFQKNPEFSYDKDRKIKIISITFSEALHSFISRIKDSNDIDYKKIREGEDYKIGILDVFI